MSIEDFPVIEDFHKMPRKLIVKGGTTSFSPEAGASLQGIVINNTGQAVKEIRVGIVVFDERKMPVRNATTHPENALLAQGGISAFSFKFQDHAQNIKDYHLYVDWTFEDKES